MTAVAPTNPRQLEGTLHQVVYQSPIDDWTILRVLDDGDALHTVTGNVRQPIPGEVVSLQGNLSLHHEFGQIFEFSTILVKPPQEESQQLQYLSRITREDQSLLETMLRRFGDDIIDIIDLHPERLTELPEIDQERADRIHARWRMEKSTDRMSNILLKFGLDPSLGPAIRRHIGEGDDTAEILRQDPFLLYRHFPDVVTFGQSFQMAQTFKLDLEHHEGLLQAAILSVLRKQLSLGHTCMESDALPVAVSKLTGMRISAEHPVFVQAMEQLGLTGAIMRADEWVYTTDCYQDENAIAIELNRLEQGPPPETDDVAYRRVFRLLEKQLKIHQLEPIAKSVFTILGHKLLLITLEDERVYPFLLQALDIVLERVHLETSFCDTGHVMSRQYAQQLKRPVVTPMQLVQQRKLGPPRYHRNHPMECDILIVAHAEAMPTYQLARLLEAMPGSAMVILMGNPKRLRPFGGGQPFYDLLAQQRLPRHHCDWQISRLIELTDTSIKALEDRTPIPRDRVILLPCRDNEIVSLVEILYRDTIPTLGVDPILKFVVSTISSRDVITTWNETLRQRLNPNGALLSGNKNGVYIGDPVSLARPTLDPFPLPAGTRGLLHEMVSGPRALIKTSTDEAITLNNADTKLLRSAYVQSLSPTIGQSFDAMAFIVPSADSHRLTTALLEEITQLAGKRLFLIGSTDAFIEGTNRPPPPRRTGLASALMRSTPTQYQHEDAV